MNKESFVWELGSQNLPSPSNFGRVLVDFKLGMDLEPADTKRLKEELLSHFAETDRGWAKNQLVNGPQGFQEHRFPGYPMLEKYAFSLHFLDAGSFGVPSGNPWIELELSGGVLRRGASPGATMCHE